jgi:hypothetical protein
MGKNYRHLRGRLTRRRSGQVVSGLASDHCYLHQLPNRVFDRWVFASRDAGEAGSTQFDFLVRQPRTFDQITHPGYPT